MSDDIPFDEWTRIPDKDLEKRGLARWVYRPSGYPGPIAQDATIDKTAIDYPGARIWLTKEEARRMWPTTPEQ
jgi:hypothetical protein